MIYSNGTVCVWLWCMADGGSLSRDGEDTIGVHDGVCWDINRLLLNGERETLLQGSVAR